MEPVDFYASERHYAEHLLPIWWALDPAERGRFYCSRQLVERLHQFHVEPHTRKPTTADGLIVVAAHSDYVLTGRRPVVYVEHGAGQSYPGDPRTAAYPGYSGGAKRDRARLFIVPSARAAARNASAYLDTPNAVVGSPKLDRWHRDNGRKIFTGKVTPTVALSFHWDCRIVPEARSAWAHYDDAMPALVAELRAAGYEVLGHGHPKLWERLAPRWAELGVEQVPEFADVLDRADVYVCDNSSTIYEFASTDRPVVLLNAPWYRRDVEHGLRFWSEASVGPQVDEPEELVATIGYALAGPAEVVAMRRASVGRVYAHADGHAAERAVAAMREHVAGIDWRAPCVDRQ